MVLNEPWTLGMEMLIKLVPNEPQARRNDYTSGTRDFHLFTPAVSLGGTE